MSQPSDTAATRLIVFSDLDGTLLDHATYDHAAAGPTLSRLRRHGIPVILASSKTAAEMVPLRTELGLSQWPMICENGAGVIGGPDESRGTDAYDRLRAVLAELPPDLRASFTGFGDMGADQIATLTGLPPEAASNAAQRQFSEPGLWTDGERDRTRFLSLLSVHGVTARQGGRFLTLSFGGSKADHMARIARCLGREVSIALGDAPNDLEMLEAADHAIVLPNAYGVSIPEISGVSVRQAVYPGPRGWNGSLGALLSELGVPE